MDNPETQATLDTRYRTKANKTKSTKQKTKKMSNTDPTKNTKQKTKKMSNTDPTKNNPFLSNLSYSFLSSTTILNCGNNYVGGKFVDKK